MSAAPMGVITETFPNAMSASPGNTSETVRVSAVSVVKRIVDPI